MRVFDALPERDTFHKAVVTIGTFDGVHIGHRNIIHQLKTIAQSVAGESVLLTFYPHPRHVLHTDQEDLKLLSVIAEKKKLLEEAGLDNLVVLPFTQELALMEAADFVKKILVEGFNLHTLVVGYDHRFGKNRAGDFNLLQAMQSQLSYQLVQIEAHEIASIAISSTRIRKALLQGDLDLANLLLGKPYGMEATVIEGLQIGRTLGFPTANLQIDPLKLIPQQGVYAVKIKTANGAEYIGMLNIGINPSIEGKGFSIEVNIFNFAQPIYGETLFIEFHKRLRSEEKFATMEALKSQLEHDKQNVLRYFM
jgi:riboflavin kinase/FMN adenylyltransferase